jgi:hypothetical protein
MKKQLLILWALFLFIGMGCGNDSGEGGDGGTTPNPETETEGGGIQPLDKPSVAKITLGSIATPLEPGDSTSVTMQINLDADWPENTAPTVSFSDFEVVAGTNEPSLPDFTLLNVSFGRNDRGAIDKTQIIGEFVVPNSTNFSPSTDGYTVDVTIGGSTYDDESVEVDEL